MYIIGEVITDQAKADEDASLTERVVMAVGKFSTYIAIYSSYSYIRIFLVQCINYLFYKL